MAPDNQRRQRRVGTVVSNRSDKTISVQVEAVRRHPLYRKPVRVRSKLLAHDAENTCEVGDVVEIVASRPYSRRKRWRLTRIVNRATLTEEEQAAVEAASAAALVVDAEPEEEIEATTDAPAVAETDVEATTDASADAEAHVEATADAPADAEAEVEADVDVDASESESR